MLTNFQISQKTKVPACCGFDCCGNHFGRIERSKYAHIHSGINRIKRTRRYAKHVERQIVRKEIQFYLMEEEIYWDELTKELNHYFGYEEYE